MPSDPPLFEVWLAEALPRAVPDETRATCSDCAMVAGPDRWPPVAFRADTKCCTYQPELHNFQVGGVLADDDPSLAWAVDMIGIRIQRRTGVTPYGIRAPGLGRLLYDRVIDPSKGAFGRMSEARCPYYLVRGGRCGVWRHRNAVCSTWFCRYEHGLRSKLLWRAILGLLRAIERTVSGWVLLELEIGSSALEALLSHDQRRDGAVADAVTAVSEATYRNLWGDWLGRERELYIEAYRLARTLSWDDICALGSTELKILTAIAVHAQERLASDELPGAVTIGEQVVYQIHPRKPDTMRASTGVLGYDPLDVPRHIIDLLPRFAGRDPAEVLAELDGEGGLDAAAVLELLDYGVLRAGSP